MPLLPLQYGEFRTGFNGDQEDTRMVVWGLRYILENYVIRQWTVEDVERADVFYRCGGPRPAAARMQLSAATRSPQQRSCGQLRCCSCSHHMGFLACSQAVGCWPWLARSGGLGCRQ